MDFEDKKEVKALNKKYGHKSSMTALFIYSEMEKKETLVEKITALEAGLLAFYHVLRMMEDNEE